MSIPALSELLDAATEVAWAGGRRTLAWFHNDVATEYKGDGSPVTAADREAEEVMRRMIAKRFPGHSIIGEEAGETRGSEACRWIIDPIDGTRTFIRGVPLYGTLVGIEVEGVPTVGVIYMPALDEMVSAALGHGCKHNGRPCRVSNTSRLADALVVTTDEAAVRARLGSNADRLIADTELTRTWADCYGYVLVATGRAEVAMDAAMAVWDCAALLPIIVEAGGRFTDWTGAARIDGGDAFATNGRLHGDVMSYLKHAPF